MSQISGVVALSIAALAVTTNVSAALTGQGWRREVHCRREIVDAIFYMVDNGIKWRALPADFPPWSTVYELLRRLGSRRSYSGCAGRSA